MPHPENLVPAHPGNQNRLVHGLYVDRPGLSDHARELADALMTLEWATPLDRIAAEEIGSLLDLLGKIDAALANGRMENRKGQARSLLDIRGRLSTKLGWWLDRFGATPASRADWTAKLTRPSFAELVAQKKAEIEAERNGHK
jgi:hypothetical protein